MFSKFVEEVEEDGTRDIVKSKERVGCLRENKKVVEKGCKALTHSLWVTPCAVYEYDIPLPSHVQHHDKR